MNIEQELIKLGKISSIQLDTHVGKDGPRFVMTLKVMRESIVAVHPTLEGCIQKMKDYLNKKSRELAVE